RAPLQLIADGEAGCNRHAPDMLRTLFAGCGHPEHPAPSAAKRLGAGQSERLVNPEIADGAQPGAVGSGDQTDPDHSEPKRN
ncbi:MAG: hypothetical protein M3O25_03565, partial [Actinomycetota bacterium]|nr:hypothetical protein [Actinomycetota bacterium]